MKLQPYTNDGHNTIHIGTVSILPGETRQVNVDFLPDAALLQALEIVVEDKRPESLIPLLDGNVGNFVAALESLSDEDLEALEALETMDKARKTALEGIAAERLKRAADQ
jgi:predicted RecB family endonuclease